MNVNVITSMQNPMLKEYNKLKKNSNYRHKSCKIALEGPNLLHEAIKTGFIPETVFFTREYYNSGNSSFLDTLPASVKQAVLPPEVFAKIADTENPQAIAAIIYFDPEEKAGKISHMSGLVLILNRLQDPGNMGSIIRTAAAAGVDIVYYTRGCVDPFNPKTLRSTAGSIFHLPVIPVHDPVELVQSLKKNNYRVIAAEVNGDKSIWDADFGGSTALIIGNEATGIDQNLFNEADCRVTIPLEPPVESLNAAAATAVIIFEVIRRRKVQCLET
ncbi:MAG: TrmH family RNA methyltransferase [Bacillota bacterium]